MHKKTLKKIIANVVIPIVSFFPVTELMAEIAPGLIPPRICELARKSGEKLTIVAGPDLTASDSSTTLASQFPETVTCPSGTGLCSKWNYRYVWENMKPSLAFVDQSSDLAILAISQAGNVSQAGKGFYKSYLGKNNFDVRWIKWNANNTTFDASFITPIAQARVASAGGKSGKFKKFCLIQGAGIGDGFVQDSVTAEKRTISADGSEICTLVDPMTQCEVGVNCNTGAVRTDAIDLEDLVKVDGDIAITASVPGQQCPTFILDNGLPNTHYYCSGGRCYAY